MEQAKKLSRGGVALFAVIALLLVGAASLALAPQKAWAYGITQTAATTNSATISWEDPNKDSSSYETTGYTVSWGADYNSATNKVALPAEQTSYTVTNLKAGTKYYVKVEYSEKSLRTGNANTYTVGSSSDVASRVTTPTGVKQSKWWYYINKVDFTWNKQNAADKIEYRVYQVGKKKVFAKQTATYPSNEFEVNKVKNNAMYTVEMRVHDKWGWSGWSKKAYMFTQPMAVAGKTKVKGNKLTVTWNKIKGATSYTVYASTKEKKGYEKLKTVKASKNSLTVKKIGKTKVNAKKKYYVYVVANKKVGKTTYTSGKHYTYQVKGKSGTVRWTFD